MMPTLAWPGVVAPGQLGPTRRAPRAVDLGHDLEHVEGRDVLGDAEDRADAGVERLEDGVRRGARPARR